MRFCFIDSKNRGIFIINCDYFLDGIPHIVTDDWTRADFRMIELISEKAWKNLNKLLKVMTYKRTNMTQVLPEVFRICLVVLVAFLSLNQTIHSCFVGSSFVVER